MKNFAVLSAMLICCLLTTGAASEEGMSLNHIVIVTLIVLGSMLIMLRALRMSMKYRQKYLNRPQPELLRKSNTTGESWSSNRTTSERNAARLKEEDYNAATAIMTPEQMAQIQRTGFIIKRLDEAPHNPHDGKLHLPHLHLPHLHLHKNTDKVSKLPYLPHD